MNIARFDAGLCKRCDQCHAALACPKGIITYQGPGGPADDLLKINTKLCLSCGKCERFCQGKAVTMG